MKASPKQIVTFVLSLFISFLSYANLWQSSTEQKYQTSYPEQYLQYIKAVKLLNSYSVGKGKQLQQAEPILSKLLEANNEFSPAYVQVARLLVYSGYLRSNDGLNVVRSLLDKAIEIEPNYAEAYLYYASLYRILKDWESVEKSLLIAKQSGTKSPWYDIHMGRLLKHKGKIDEAMKAFDLVFARKDISSRDKSFAVIELRDYYNSIDDHEKSLGDVV